MVSNKGFIPSDKEPESVSKTLEYAYRRLVHCPDGAKTGTGRILTRNFFRASQSYQNLFDPSTGFFRAKSQCGLARARSIRYEVNFNYTEANAWQYRFCRAARYQRLSQLARRGANNFAARLDSLFSAPATTTGRDQADMTGLIGQYAHGNEPSHHIAYLYNYRRPARKTQHGYARSWTNCMPTGRTA